jgi:hypothetical protein
MEGPGERDGIRRRGEYTLDRPVGMALTPYRVHCHATFEVEHRHDTHRPGE